MMLSVDGEFLKAKFNKLLPILSTWIDFFHRFCTYAIQVQVLPLNLQGKLATQAAKPAPTNEFLL